MFNISCTHRPSRLAKQSWERDAGKLLLPGEVPQQTSPAGCSLHLMAVVS